MADYNRDEMRRQERKLEDAKRSQQIVDSMRTSKEWPQSVKIGEEKCETLDHSYHQNKLVEHPF